MKLSSEPTPAPIYRFFKETSEGIIKESFKSYAEGIQKLDA